MTGSSPPTLHLPQRRLAVAVAAATAILLLALRPAAASWDRAHADGANSGFVDVATAPAGRGSVSVPGIGTFAPGAGPVIAPDGTVYIGNQQGRLLAFHADGRPAWSRELPRGQAITASPAVGADGTIYVVGVARYRDHRVDPPVVRYESTLHRFVPGGGWLGGTPFPERYTALDAFRGRGFTSAPPNISRSSGVESVIVPAVYYAPGGSELRLLAFSTGGGVVAGTRVTYVSSGPITSHSEANLPGWLCLVPPVTVGCTVEGLLELAGRTLIPSFTASISEAPPDVHRLPAHRAPLPGVAVTDGTPWVIVSDSAHDVVGYSFTPGNGFTEMFRAHYPQRTVTSPPTITRDGHSAFGTAGKTDGAIIFAGPSEVQTPVVPVGFVRAAPTRLADGRLVVVEGAGLAVLRGYADVQRIPQPGGSIAAAAASRNHVFVSTASAFYTYDARTLAEVSRIDWVGGGLSPPAIGPQGHVYAIASNILFVFPPPKICRRCSVVVRPIGGAGVAPVLPVTPLAESRRYDGLSDSGRLQFQRAPQ